MEHVSRRTFLGLPGLSAVSAAASPAHPGSFTYAGINYDTGTCFAPGEMSAGWHEARMEEDMRAIRSELDCNAVQVFGKGTERLLRTAAYASRTGLAVLVQPRLFHAGMADVREHILCLAKALAPLHSQYPGIALNLGCELSLFTQGFIPGATVEKRTAQLSANRDDIPASNKRLNSFLQGLLPDVKQHFKGRITYSAGSWEDIDWSGLDFVSVNFYRDITNSGDYVQQLKNYRRQGKPLFISEFGCCCYKGADSAGAAGHDIIDWKTTGPEIKPGYVRDETVQAAYLQKLIHLYAAQGVTGVFPYVFGHPAMPHARERKYDLDMASYGIVKYNSEGRWEKKAAFETLARLYRINRLNK